MSVCGGGMAEGASKVRVKKAVKKVFAGFAADGEAPGDVGTGRETALDRIADGFVFILNFFAYFYAGLIFLKRFGADIGKIVIEHDRAFIHGKR